MNLIDCTPLRTYHPDPMAVVPPPSADVRLRARLAYELLRVIDYTDTGEMPPAYDLLSAADQEHLTRAVQLSMPGHSPRDQHTLWVEAQTRAGWAYGYPYDAAVKRDPRLIAYQDRRPIDRLRDDVFHGIACGVLSVGTQIRVHWAQTRPAQRLPIVVELAYELGRLVLRTIEGEALPSWPGLTPAEQALVWKDLLPLLISPTAPAETLYERQRRLTECLTPEHDAPAYVELDLVTRLEFLLTVALCRVLLDPPVP